MNFIHRWNIGKVEPIEGWYIKFTAPIQPLKVPMQKLFNIRNKGGLVKTIAKRISTAAGYGKFIERHEDGTIGRYYNPLYAAMTSTMTRLQVCQFIYRHKLIDHLVHVGVDGILTTKNVTIKDKVAMGNWKENPLAPALVLSPGRVYTGDKKPHGLNYDIITNMFNDKPRESFYRAKLYRRQTLTESIELNDLKHIGDMKETNSSVDINLLRTSQNRIFKEFPRTGGDIMSKNYHSEPPKI
jgi:hypothetical protein